MGSMLKLKELCPPWALTKTHDIRLLNKCLFVVRAGDHVELREVCAEFNKDARIDVNLAPRYGVDAVIGTDEDLSRLRYLSIPLSDECIQMSIRALRAGQVMLSRWLKDGDRCYYSDTVAQQLFPFVGVEPSRLLREEFTVDSLRRILTLLVSTNTEGLVPTLKFTDPDLVRVCTQWDTLVRSYKAEVVSLGTRGAPNTAALLNNSSRPN